jgi:methyltransferase
MIAPWIIAAVAVQRLVELAIARRNTARLKARGGTESGGEHYPLIVVLHLSWLAVMLLFLPRPETIHLVPLTLFGVLQLGRVWVLATLGPYFTTRVITLPGAALVRTGPYRFVRHPNYLIVAGEIAALPLAFGEVAVALVFSALNAVLLARRIRVEDMTLAPRR